MLQPISPNEIRPLTERYLALHTGGSHFLLLRAGPLRELLRGHWPHAYGTELLNEQLENNVRLVGEQTMFDLYPHLHGTDMIAFESDEYHTNQYVAPAEISLLMFRESFYIQATILGYNNHNTFISPRIPFIDL